MDTLISSSKFQILIALLISIFSCAVGGTHEEFLHCLSFSSIKYSTSIPSTLIYTPTNPSYSSVLESSIRNLRFNTTSTPKPLLIVTPTEVSHVQAAIACSRKHDMQIRVRSGGHDYEGLSYVSPLPFVIVDMINLQDINVDLENETAWVQAGSTIGKLYYTIAQKSRTLAYPAGTCPTVGIGGHFSGGGYGLLLRKYGLAADNVIDAQFIDVNGRVLDRSSMGEDLFWAIRGGGGNSFGVVVAWKVRLVAVPPTVTVFTVQKSPEENATKLVHRWQYIASELPEDLFVGLSLMKVNASEEGSRAVQATFNALFLGGIEKLLPLMKERFPELGLVEEDCREMSWIETIPYFAGFPNDAPLDDLLDRTPLTNTNFKAKSDYVKEPIPESVFDDIMEKLSQADIKDPQLIIIPYGGKMAEISESSLPFPHRAGNLYKISYIVHWNEEGMEATNRHISWMRSLYSYMAPFVSKNPREAYINYRDLDIGTNNIFGKTSYRQASEWGNKYFLNNFERLVRVKTAADPKNFFRHDQSIPPL